MLKSLRKKPLINRLGRNVLQWIGNMQRFLEKRWRLSGVVQISHNGNHFRMYSECDDGILEPLFYGNDYIETNDLNAFSKLIHHGDIILDIGANTGLYSIVSSIASQETIIYAFEPNPINLVRLNRNIELNSISNISIIPFAVGNSNQEISFTVPEDDSLSDTSSAVESFSKSTYRGELKWKNIKVSQVRIDDFIKSHNIAKINMLKIDVEGYEIEVLKGSMQSILRWKPVILIESFLNDDKRTFLEKFVQEAGYTIYLIFKEGIVRIGGKFENNAGLNYLLMNYETKNVFTKMVEVKR